MRKKLIFLLLCIVVACSVTLGVVFADDPAVNPDEEGGVAAEIYTLDVGGAKLSVNTQNLNMSVTKGGRTWYSGNRHVSESGEIDDGWEIDSFNGAMVTDGLTITYRNANSLNKIPRTAAITELADEPVRDFKKRDDGFDAKIRLAGNIGISFTLQVRFDGNVIKATIPDSSIVESSPDMRLEQISLFPYFDSSFNQTEGQIFIPDGSGALIDLSIRSNATKDYSQRIYGDDYGLTTPSARANQPKRATMPVIATMYPDGGTVVTVTGGAEYVKANASVSGIGQDPYNRANFTFIYREPYTRYYDDSGDPAKSSYELQADRNVFDAQVTYTLMDEGVNIADVAKVYRDMLDINQKDISTVGLRLQFLMAENKESMFGRQTVKMTTPEYVLNVAKEVSYYCDGLSVSLTGYQRNGLGGADPSVFPMTGKSSYRKLGEDLNNMDVPMSFAVDYVRLHDRASVSNSRLLQNISEQFVTLADTRAGSGVTFRLIKPSYTEQLLRSDVNKLSGFYAGIDAANIGAMLFSGYKSEVFSRSDLIADSVRLIGDVQLPVALSNPNDYMFGVIDSYIDTPIEYSSYLIETESVPFLQMVLGGSIPMYSEALNLDYTGQTLVLKLIHSNVYPSFILTDEDPIELYGTDSQCIFTSSFGVWNYKVRDTYEQVSNVLREVVGQQIVRRDKVADNVFVNTYSNGVKTVVNYSANPITYQGALIEAMSAAAVR